MIVYFWSYEWVGTAIATVPLAKLLAARRYYSLRRVTGSHYIWSGGGQLLLPPTSAEASGGRFRGRALRGSPVETQSPVPGVIVHNFPETGQTIPQTDI